MKYNNMNEEPEKQRKNRVDYIREYQWQKGQSGNPKGRPKTKTLKEFAREFLANMSEDARIAYLESVDPKIIWEMAEGKPKQDVDVTANVNIASLLDEVEHGQTTIGQDVEVEEPLQDTQQGQSVS